jgi:hypothetical protein
MLIKKKNRDQRKDWKAKKNLDKGRNQASISGVFCSDTILEIARSNMNKEKRKLRKKERERSFIRINLLA